MSYGYQREFCPIHISFSIGMDKKGQCLRTFFGFEEYLFQTMSVSVDENSPIVRYILFPPLVSFSVRRFFEERLDNGPAYTATGPFEYSTRWSARSYQIRYNSRSRGYIDHATGRALVSSLLRTQKRLLDRILRRAKEPACNLSIHR